VQVDPGNAINGIACPSLTLCVAVDDAGNVVTSTDPSGGAAAWSVASIDAGRSLNAVSCSSVSQCVAVDDAGNELNSINPAGGATAWTGARIGVPSGTPLGGPAIYPLEAISCPAEAMCIAVDGAGNAYVGRPTPSNLVLPAISGGAIVGQTLQEGHGNWTDSPTSLDVFWERCDAHGNACSPLPGADGQTYVLTGADAGTTMRAIEVASNANGNGTPEESEPTPVVTWQPPVSLSPPGVSGSPTEGQTLSELPASWGNVPTGYSYQWEDCDGAGGGCAPIAGATGKTYTLAGPDVGHTIRVREIATNPGGQSTPATSPVTGIVQVAPVASSTVSTSGTAATARAHTKGTLAIVPVTCTGAPGAVCALTVAITVTETIAGGKVIAVTAGQPGRIRTRKRVLVLGGASATVKAGQSQIITISLDRVGRTLLARRHSFKANLAVTENSALVSSSTIAFKTKAAPKTHGKH
jgi:hypothetical protein